RVGLRLPGTAGRKECEVPRIFHDPVVGAGGQCASNCCNALWSYAATAPLSRAPQLDWNAYVIEVAWTKQERWPRVGDHGSFDTRIVRRCAIQLRLVVAERFALISIQIPRAAAGSPAGIRCAADDGKRSVTAPREAEVANAIRVQLVCIRPGIKHEID